MLTQMVRSSIRESVLCCMATADTNGRPNVSPKEMFVAFGDDELLIANIASPESVSNIRSNPNVCVSFIHVFKQKVFKLRGKAQIVRKNDPHYNKLREKLYSLGGREFEIKSIIRVKVERVSPIVSPNYRLFPETTELLQEEQAMKTYGVSRDDT